MRKLVIVLILALSFVLGNLSEGVIAMGRIPDGWFYPEYRTKAPDLSGYFCLQKNPGVVFYTVPAQYKLVSLGRTNLNNLWVKLLKKE